MPIRVRICGHSFPRRLYEHIMQNRDRFCPNFGLFPDSIDCRWDMVGGAKLGDFPIHAIISSKPHIVLFDIGSNDLCEPTLDVLAWAAEYNDKIEELLHHHQDPVSTVVLLPIFHRSRRGVAGMPDGVQTYNARVDQANQYMQNYAESHNNKVIFWKHEARAPLRSNDRTLLGDGIHLKQDNQQHYYWSIRTAISYAEDVVRGKRVHVSSGGWMSRPKHTLFQGSTSVFITCSKSPTYTFLCVNIVMSGDTGRVSQQTNP